jgi:hypothetical protein
MTLFSITANPLLGNVMQNSALNFSINPAARSELVRLGPEQTPLIIIDDFMLDLAAVRQCALQSAFSQDADSYYPGVRAALPKDYVAATLNALYQLIYQVYQVPQRLRLKPQMLFYALISQQQNSLHPLQCMPHFDTSAPYYFALLHYLNEAPHGSTGFFRHIPTGYHRITDDRRAAYFSAAQSFIDQHGAPEQQYFVKTNQHYELYYQVPYQANRLVIYPGNLLHSTLVEPDLDISDSPVTGRLTANMFIDFL